MTQTNILIVDDESKILDVVSSFLTNHNYHVFCATNAKDALSIFMQQNISLIILDLMLPDMGGEQLCMQIRQKSRVPIIMLTAKVSEENTIYGLEMGADDYMHKPFSLKELKARIEVILRRSSDDLIPLFKKNSFHNNDLIVDFESHCILKRNQVVKLTATEHKILSTFIKYPNKVFTREELIALVYDDHFDSYHRAIDSHIKNLRQKIEDDPKASIYILTIHGKGYKFGG